MSRTDHPVAIDMFSGVGGFSLGAQLVGWNVRAAFELDTAARHAYRVNLADGDASTAVYGGDITDRSPDLLDYDVDAIFGGPPCQPFSTAKGEHYDGDPWDTGLFTTIEWIDTLQPAVFAIENVDGLTNNHNSILERLLAELTAAGYNVQQVEANAADYGVPQKRHRVFILGVSTDLPAPDTWTPQPTRSQTPGQTTLDQLNTLLDGYKTARNAIGDLPEPLPPQKPGDDPVHLTPFEDDSRVLADTTPSMLRRDAMGRYRDVTFSAAGYDDTVSMPPNHVSSNHKAETREKYSQWPLGYSGGRTTSRRLHPDEPAPTMTVSNGTPPVHYAGHSPSTPDEPIHEVRRLTPREVARIQTFPDSFTAAGTRFEQFQQFGNAVPPRLAGAIADHLLRHIAPYLGFEHLYEHLPKHKRPKPTRDSTEKPTPTQTSSRP